MLENRQSWEFPTKSIPTVLSFCLAKDRFAVNAIGRSDVPFGKPCRGSRCTSGDMEGEEDRCHTELVTHRCYDPCVFLRVEAKRGSPVVSWITEVSPERLQNESFTEQMSCCMTAMRGTCFTRPWKVTTCGGRTEGSLPSGVRGWTSVIPSR